MNRNWIIFILSLPILFCLGIFLWQANPLLILVPFGIAALIFMGIFIAFIISAELTSFEAWDLLIRSVLFRLGFKVNPPKSLEHEHDEDEHSHGGEGEKSSHTAIPSTTPTQAAESEEDFDDEEYEEDGEEIEIILKPQPIIKPITRTSSGPEELPDWLSEETILEESPELFGGAIEPKSEESKEDRIATEVPIDDLLSTETKVEETHFTAYYPRQVNAKQEYGFFVYAHLPDALIQADIQQFSTELGGRIPKATVSPKTSKLKDGALLTTLINCDKLKFNQMGSMQVWKAPFVRFEFKFTADELLIDEIIEGRIAICLGLIEIASIDFRISVGATLPTNAVETKGPIIYPPSDSVPPYQKIFVSYSRKDTIVAEQYRAAQSMLGNTIFMDVHTIRAGEDWEQALKRFITEADVFQLFWSEHSANSDHVRFEWEYALQQRCPDTLCRQFIRPTYWQKPLAPIPSELGHLHFAYVEVQTKTGDSV